MSAVLDSVAELIHNSVYPYLTEFLGNEFNKLLLYPMTKCLCRSCGDMDGFLKLLRSIDKSLLYMFTMLIFFSFLSVLCTRPRRCAAYGGDDLGGVQHTAEIKWP